MKRLTETWRQRKTLTGEKHAVKPDTAEPEFVKLLKTGTKRLGRVAISSTNRIRCSNPCDLHGVPTGGNNNGKTSDLSFMSSFGPDLDEEIISVVNSIEEALQGKHQEGLSKNSSVCNGSKILSQSHTSSKKHSGIPQSLQNESRNPSKRKNSRSRTSGKRETVVFGDSKTSWLLSTPTQSPADKKRKEDSFVPAGRTSRVQISSQESCGVTIPSRNFLSQEQLYQQGVPGVIKKSLPQKSTEVRQAFYRDGRKTADCHEEEILVEVSPTLSDTTSIRLENVSSLVKKFTGDTAQKETPCLFRDHQCKQNQITTTATATNNVEKGSGDENIAEHSEVTKCSPKGKRRECADAKRSTKSSFFKESPHDGQTVKDSDDLCVPVPDSTSAMQGLAAQTSETSSNKPSRRICSSKTSGLESGVGEQGLERHQQHASGSEPERTSVLSLSAWGLPPPVLEAYQTQGITTMFPWQAECLTTGSVLAGGNLVYSAPTSGGKTMVAELLVLKRVLEIKRKALFILPFVSVTREKMLSLQRLYQDAGIRVGGFMGGYSPAGGFQSVDVAVCTIEKGNSLVNRLMEENRMGELGVVVIDELHLVGDSSRGYLLELLLTKVCFLAQKSRENGNQTPVQVIGMSATLPNLDLLAKWLHADLYHTDFRPVPLTEHIKVGPVIYDASMKRIRELDARLILQGDDDHIIPLCLETLLADHSVLIFCPTKAWCEKMAERIAREFYLMIKNPTVLAGLMGETGFVKASELIRLPIDQGALQNVVEQLGRSAAGVDPMLGRIVMCGVAYHHAGLTFDERDIVEGAFRQGLLKVLVATSTLSSGVNLPARRVIVRSPMFGGRVMDTLTYKQMAGRAGRKGVDTAGECILVCKENEKKAAQNLLQEGLPKVVSCLSSGSDRTELSRSLKRAILEVVVSGVAPTPKDVARYVDCTLLSASLPSNSTHTDSLISSCLKFLEDNEFVHLTVGKNEANQEIAKYQPTQLGSAVLGSSMSPDEGLAVFAELQKARQCFVLSNELHIIYLVTPIYNQEISSNLDWYHFFCLWERLPADQRSVAKLVGVEEGFLAKAITGRVQSKTTAQAQAVAVHKRFYTALALHDLVQEMPLLEVAERYRCNKGQLQSLMQSAATFAGMVTVFCARLGWFNMELLFSQFQQRLTLGVTRELCDLVRIPLLTASTARMLFNAGYQTVTSVAHAQPTDIENLFRKTSPFQSNKKQEGETDWEFEQRQKACVWLAGRRGLSELEAAVAIISEAKALIQDELGVKISWGNEQMSPAESLSASTSFSANDHVSDMQTPYSPRKLSSRCESHGLVVPGNRGKESPVLQCGVAKDHFVSPTNRKSFESCSSSGGKSAPVGVSQQTSAKRGSGSHGHLTQIKRRSPSLGSRQTQSRNSERELSFYGQTVLSPPPCLQKVRQKPSTPMSTNHGEVETSRSVSGEIHSGKFRKIDVDGLLKGAQQGTDLAPCTGISGENNTSRDSISSCLEIFQHQHEQKSGGNSLSSLAAAELKTPSAAVDCFCDKRAQEENKDSEGIEAYFEESFVLDTQTVKLLTGERCTVTKSSHNHQHEVCEQVTSSTVFSCKTNPCTPCHDETEGKFLYCKDVAAGENSLRTALPVTSVATNICTDQRVGFDSPQKEKRHSQHRGSQPKSLAKLQTVQGQLTPPAAQEDPDDLGEDWIQLEQSDLHLRKVTEKNVDCEPQENMGEVPPNNEKPVNDQAGDGSTSSIVDNEENQSVSLIAASNYDRVAYLEGVVEDEAGCLDLNSSYQDLGIRLCSGHDRPVIASGDQEFTFTEDAGSKEAMGIVRKNFTPGAGYNVQEDLAIAVNFSNESFSLLVTNSSDVKTSSPLIQNRLVDSATHSKEQESFFGDSFTASMMDKIMEENIACAQDDQDLRHTGGKTVTGKTVWKDKALNYSATGSKKCPSFQDQLSAGKTPTKGMLGEHQGVLVHQCLDKTEKRNSLMDRSNCSSKATTPQNNDDFVPPTPPEEQSSMSTPRLRKTPLRACKNRGHLEAALNQGKANTEHRHVEDRKKKRNKENCEENKKQLSKSNKNDLKTSTRSEQSEQAAIKTLGNPACSDESMVPSSNEKGRDFKRHPKGKVDVTSPDEEERLSDREAVSDLPTQESFTIIDVCANAQLFSTFVSEWKRKTSYAISLACDKKIPTRNPEDGIGGHFMRSVKSSSADLKATDEAVQGLEIPGDAERVLVGLAVSWECRDAYYISLDPFGNGDSATCLDDTMSAPPADESITLDQRTRAIKNILKLTLRQTLPTTVTVYDSKAVYSMLATSVGAVFRHSQDPKIAAWLMDPGGKERNLYGMVTNFLPHDLGLLEGLGGGVGYGSLGLTTANPASGRMRAAAESIISRRLMDVFRTKLADAGLERAFIDIEMPSVVTMARMELNGIGFSDEECESQKTLMMARLTALEEEAYCLASHPFSLTSTEDIAQILYLELQLPVNGDPQAKKPVRTLGPSRRAVGHQKPAFSTSKEVLEKLKPFHPLPAIILEWRRISSALTKQVYPLQKVKEWSNRTGMFRIFGECQMHTATGRVSMSEPNLQNIPKDFEITLPDVIGESPPSVLNKTTPKATHHRARAGNCRLKAVQGTVPQAACVSNPTSARHASVSMRHAFIPFRGGVIIAADYSQLELRVIAHLSGDKKLIGILNDDGDVFKMIAAQWKHIAAEAVTAEQRQQAKQVCYGMLYGIGAKALGEQLGVEENDAAVFIETFKARYTGLRSYLRKTVEECRENGYVTTISGRRRNLAPITSMNPHARAQAERQAVNTTVQGSAADIVKKAMNKIDQRLMNMFPDTRLPHKLENSGTKELHGAFLILQLHDELIYEASQGEATQVACIIKEAMETAVSLLVKLPVKVKLGSSWGRLQEMEI